LKLIVRASDKKDIILSAEIVGERKIRLLGFFLQLAMTSTFLHNSIQAKQAKPQAKRQYFSKNRQISP